MLLFDCSIVSLPMAQWQDGPGLQLFSGHMLNLLSGNLKPYTGHDCHAVILSLPCRPASGPGFFCQAFFSKPAQGRAKNENLTHFNWLA
jgi:hypothetical protein